MGKKKNLLSNFGSLPKLRRLMSEPVDGEPTGRDGRGSVRHWVQVMPLWDLGEKRW